MCVCLCVCACVFVCVCLCVCACVCVRVCVTPHLSPQEMKGQSITFLLAGYETTSTALCFLVNELAHNPDVQRRVQEELDQVFPDEVRACVRVCVCECVWTLQWEPARYFSFTCQSSAARFISWRDKLCASTTQNPHKRRRD